MFEFISMPKRIIAGVGSVSRVGKEAIKFGKNALIITDKGVRGVGLLNDLIDSLNAEGVRYYIFDNVKTEPDLENARIVSKISRDGSYDLVIGVGGGSCLDMAKVASIMATNPGDVSEYFGENLVKNKSLPMILIPTTSGSGSEATKGSVISVGEIKSVIFSDMMIAELAILDPKMSMSMPPMLTAVTGMDALAHAIESMMSKRSNPISSTLAEGSIKLISENLEVAYTYGDNLNARMGMAIAATMAGASFANSSVILGHGISYALGTLFKMSHGMGCAIALPYVVDYNSSVVPNIVRRVAISMGINTDGLDDKKVAGVVVRTIIDMLKRLNLPTTLREMGIPKDSVVELADLLLNKYSRLLRNNPRDVDRDSAIAIFNNLWEGKFESLS